MIVNALFKTKELFFIFVSYVKREFFFNFKETVPRVPNRIAETKQTKPSIPGTERQNIPVWLATEPPPNPI